MLTEYRLFSDSMNGIAFDTHGGKENKMIPKLLMKLLSTILSSCTFRPRAILSTLRQTQRKPLKCCPMLPT